MKAKRPGGRTKGAAALIYMAAEKRGFNVSKPQIAVILNVSKFTVRDMVGRLRRYTQSI